MQSLIDEVHNCRLCRDVLPHEPNPVIQFSIYSKIVIIGQAPGRRVHETGIPWNDPSGRKLRSWMNIDEQDFYNPELISLIPMGFCYPGKGISGDLPPVPICAKFWHHRIFSEFTSDPLVILIGQYAQKHYLDNQFKGNLTNTVQSYKEYLPKYFPLPHPSPRNQNWVKVNQWFTDGVLPDLKKMVASSLKKI